MSARSETRWVGWPVPTPLRAARALTEIRGISEVLAAKILGHTGPISRFATSDADANYSGTAPIEVSSGAAKRHRLSRRGNRQLNNAIHMAAHVQRIHPGPGRDYYRRKLATGKSPNEAMRCLKRQMTKTIYRTLKQDVDRALATEFSAAN